jgi:flavin-dependent dehydrogenase
MTATIIRGLQTGEPRGRVRIPAERYDVVVVGAGIAGLTTARLLGENGLRVFLADHKCSVDEQVATTGIFVRRTLEDFSFLPEWLGPAIHRVTIHAPDGRPTTLSSPHAEFRVGNMGRIYCGLLKAATDAGVAWSPGAHFVSVVRGDAGSIIRFRREGASFVVRARYIVGADGCRSTVARSLGLDRNHRWIVGVEDILTGAPSRGLPQLHCFLDPVLAPGYLAWVVQDGVEVHLGLAGDPDRFDPRSALDRFRERAAAVVDLGEARLVERRGGRIPINGILKTIASRHGMLVGDAAGAVSPLTAGGLDPCFRLSELAAAVIVDYLETGDERVLKQYSGTRFRRRFAVRRALRWSWSVLGRSWMVTAALKVLRVWPFSIFVRRVFFGHGSFPDTRSTRVRPAEHRLGILHTNSFHEGV